MPEVGPDQLARRLEAIILGIGQPSLEDKIVARIEAMISPMRGRIEQVARHGERNMQDGDAGVMHLLSEETQARKEQHSENKEENKQTRQWMGEITKLVEQVRGMIRLGGALAGLVAIAWTVIQIRNALHR